MKTKSDQLLGFKNEMKCSSREGGLMHGDMVDFLFGREVVNKSESGLKGGDSASVSLPQKEEEEVYPCSIGSYREFLVLYCSFVDGFDRGIRFPLIYVLKTKYHLTQLVAFTAFGLAQTPWLAKPFIALVTDSVPWQGLKRAPYLGWSGSLNAATLAGIGAVSVSQWGGFGVPTALMVVRTFCRATTRSVIQGMLVEDSQIDGDSITGTDLRVSQFNTAHRLGQLISVVGSALILFTTTSVSSIFFSVAAFNLGQVVLSLFLEEQEVVGVDDETIEDKLDQLRSVAFDHPALKSLYMFAILSASAPTFEARMFYYLMDVHGVDAWGMSVITIWQTAAGVVAPMLYCYVSSEGTEIYFLRFFTFLAVPVALLPLAITAATLPVNWIVPISSSIAFLMTLTSHCQRLPVNVLQVKLAKRGIEGACFSLFAMAEGVGHVGSNLYSGAFPILFSAAASTNYAAMPLYLIFSSVYQLVPLGTVTNLESELEEYQTLDRIMPASS